MAREFSVSSGGLTVVNAVVTLAFINPSATIGVEILRVWVSQSGTPTANQQRIQLVTQVTAFPTLVSATPRPAKLRDAVSGIVGATTGAAGTAGVNASAEGAGTKTVYLEDAFNVATGWLWIPTERERLVLNAGLASGLGVYLPVAATTLTNWAVGITFAELI